MRAPADSLGKDRAAGVIPRSGAVPE
jgi:hypothetical protein